MDRDKYIVTNDFMDFLIFIYEIRKEHNSMVTLHEDNIKNEFMRYIKDDNILINVQTIL